MGEYFIVARQFINGSKYGIEGAVLNMNNEKVWSHDFEEITLAIALLGGLLAFLFKLISYFNENIILWSESTQSTTYFLVGALLVEFLIILLFFIFKGILISTKNKRRDLEDTTRGLFEVGFIFPFIWFITTLLLVLENYITQDFNTNHYMPIGYTFLIFIIDCILYVNLVGKEELENALDRVSKNIIVEPEILEFLIIILISILIPLLYYIITNISLYIISLYMYAFVYAVLILIIDAILSVKLWRKEVSNKFIELPKKIERIKLEQLISFILIIILFMYPFLKLYSDLFLVGPSILLMGSFSIEESPQSIDNADTLTFTIKETGLTYYKNYINLYKLNVDNNSLNTTDNITLLYTLEQKSKLMIGGQYDKGLWYLNINTSNLQPGSYMLHSEVTNPLTINSTFGIFKKHSDKLFYISPKSTNYSSNSTQH